MNLKIGNCLYIVENEDIYIYRYIKSLEAENEKLKKEVEIKHDGFMARIDDVCEYAKENDKLRSAIDRAIYCLKDMQFQYDGLGNLDVAIKILESGIKE